MPQDSPTNRLGVEKNRKKTNKNLRLVGKKILATYHSFRKKHSNFFFLVEKIVKGIFLDVTISPEFASINNHLHTYHSR